jgi:hypothetical protein
VLPARAPGDAGRSDGRAPKLSNAPPAVDLAEHGHWKRLKAVIEPRAAANPNDAEAQWLLSRVWLAFRDPDRALAPAEKAVALDGKNADYRWQLAQVVGELASNASIFKQLGWRSGSSARRKRCSRSGREGSVDRAED